jgi:hypothetical protein
VITRLPTGRFRGAEETNRLMMAVIVPLTVVELFFIHFALVATRPEKWPAVQGHESPIPIRPRVHHRIFRRSQAGIGGALLQHR